MGLIIDTRDQNFVLFEMLGLPTLLESERYGEHTVESIQMILELANQIGSDEVLPAYQAGDRDGAKFERGEITTPHCYKDLLRVMNESGLLVTTVKAEDGGIDLPHLVDVACREHFAFNMGFLLYPDAAIGAARLISSYGSEGQKRRYMDPMIEGRWGGTMVLTEPAAGSDVGALLSKAVRQDDGTYRLSGSKIFITSGDSDLYENVVHPVLARVEGDPDGTRGISIFLVPKYRVNEDGSLGERNDLAVTGIEEKMGLHGSATCSMTFGDNGDCYAELLGEPRQGMKIMFQMMNGARIGMGLQGTSTASAAYLHALDYARGRIQGDDITGTASGKVPIIQHPDVRRMLMEMKTTVEGLRALVYFCAYADDMTQVADGPEREHWQGIVDLIVPVVKAYGTDQGFRVTETAIQVHGGYGYTAEFPVEQMMRDMKIGSIYEGTNGIQSLDLVGRKLSLGEGAHFMNLLAMMNATIDAHADKEALKDLSQALREGIHSLVEAAGHFRNSGKQGNPLTPIVKAYPFLELMGNVMLGWLHLWQAGIAHAALATAAEDGRLLFDWETLLARATGDKETAFYVGKIQGALFYGRNVLPKTASLATIITNDDLSILSMPDASFG
jgi:alkylation response protein AidB-like acyl-CoA dehydrogenase